MVLGTVARPTGVVATNANKVLGTTFEEKTVVDQIKSNDFESLMRSGIKSVTKYNDQERYVESGFAQTKKLMLELKKKT